ncbi:MAG: hypothetical protein GQ569_14925, partial [Methylococcaceae bacterium]|nr:hypothetical protein [Methylococcaceae bacterium]
MKLFLKILLIIFISLKPHLSFAIEESVTLKQKFKSVSFRVRQNLKRDAIYNFKSYLVRDMFDPMEWAQRKYWRGLGQHHIFPLEEHQVFPEDFLKEIMLLRKAVNGTTDREYSDLVMPLFLADKPSISRFPKIKTHLTAKFETYYEDSQQELMFLERLLDNKSDKQIAQMLTSFWLGQIGPYFSGAAKLYPYILAAKDPITPVIYRRYYYADAK